MPDEMVFNRQDEDLGNIIAMEHLNLTVPDQSLATQFYVSGLGLTRDPFVDFGQFNVWINAGRQQFHLPSTKKAQVMRGEIGLAVPNIHRLASRLSKMDSRFAGSRFSIKAYAKHLIVTCPWGNKFRCFDAEHLGVPYLEFNVEESTLGGISRFYKQVFGVPVQRKTNLVSVSVGLNQELRFKTSKYVADYDGHHIAIYTPNFSKPYEQILSAGHIAEESDQHQYRFINIFDPESGDVLYELEHEVRSLHHPMYNRNLVNRNAEQTFRHYVSGRDTYYPSEPNHKD